MNTIDAIRSTIDALPDNAVFTSRHMVKHGFRNTVDQAMSRLVKGQVIQRIARGVFIKWDSALPTDFEIVQAKANSFGKTVVSHGQTVAIELKIMPEQKDAQNDDGNARQGQDDPSEYDIVFQVSGRTSSFKTGGRRIHMKGATERKIRLGEQPIGRLIRALWHIGQKVGSNHLYTVIAAIPEDVISAALELSAWMPAWLSNSLRDEMEFKSATAPC